MLVRSELLEEACTPTSKYAGLPHPSAPDVIVPQLSVGNEQGDSALILDNLVR